MSANKIEKSFWKHTLKTILEYGYMKKEKKKLEKKFQ